MIEPKEIDLRYYSPKDGDVVVFRVPSAPRPGLMADMARSFPEGVNIIVLPKAVEIEVLRKTGDETEESNGEQR